MTYTMMRKHHFQEEASAVLDAIAATLEGVADH